MESNAHFLLGVSLVDPTADPIVLEFQQQLYQEKRIAIRAPYGLYRSLGTDNFAEHVAEHYLQQHPGELARVGRTAVVQAIRNAIEWGQADSRHPKGLL